MFKSIKLALFLCLLLLASPSVVFAESWWGKGARPAEWVLAHGGSVVRYKIIANGANNRYKAIMYKAGKFVEVENGKSGKFDDPKNATYVIKAARGGVDEKNKTRSGGKAILSATVTAHPGEEIMVVLDTIKDKVAVSSNFKTAVAKADDSKKNAEKAVYSNKIEVENKTSANEVKNNSNQSKTQMSDPIKTEIENKTEVIGVDPILLSEEVSLTKYNALEISAKVDCQFCSEMKKGGDPLGTFFPVNP